MRRSFIKKGWSIDVDYFKNQQDKKHARVIPSPERRKEENQNVHWVIPAVPVELAAKTTREGFRRSSEEKPVH